MSKRNMSSYTWGTDPTQIPVDWGDQWTDAEQAALGIAKDPELQIGRLTETWNGHPVGSLVASGLVLEGHQFHVIRRQDDE